MAGDDGDLRVESPTDQAAVPPKPPTTAEGLLARYADGERSFAGANLRGAIFDGGTLSDINLTGAELTKASFRRAALDGADLTKATGLLPRALAGANLSGAKLPDYLKEFADIKRAQGLADSAQKLFLAVLGAPAYTVLTVATTTDPQLMMVSTPTELPIIKTPIPTLGFFWVAPILLAGLFVYFHLYLQRLWETLAALPAILPDGAALDERVDPWLVNSLIRRRTPRLRETESARVPWLGLQDWIVSFAAWWVAPLSLVPIWWRYLTRHDWFGTSLQMCLIGVAVVAACYLRGLSRATLGDACANRYLRRP